MTAIPPSLSRVPNSLATRLSLSNITRTNVDLLRLQEQLATQRSILRSSDDVVKAATIGVLDERLERSQQLERNLDHAKASLGILDSLFSEASTAVLEAKDIASDQANITSSATERASQATVVDQVLRSMFNIANRQSVSGFALGGSVTTRQPVQDFFGFFRYAGEGAGIVNDLDQASTVPITLGPTPIIGRSSRVRGDVDLNPQLTGATRLSDIQGARGLGVAQGPLEFSFRGGQRQRIDIANADSVQDVADQIESVIRAYETSSGQSILGPGGVSFSGEGLTVDVAPGAGNTLEFFDVGTGVTAKDVGLVTFPATVYGPGVGAGQALGVKLTMRSPVSSLAGVTGALGVIRVSNAGRSADVDLSQAQTIEDVRNAIEASNLGVRVSINESGTGIDVLNEVSAGSTNALSIGEVAGNNQTATRLGIRTMAPTTRIEDFNFGRGVEIIDGVADPITGVVSADLNADFAIELGTGQRLSIDLRPGDMLNVSTLLTAINAQIGPQLATLGLPATYLVAELADTGNGIALRQDTSSLGALVIEPLNNSPAAEQLGLLGAGYDYTTGLMVGKDVSKVRVDSVFSALVDLRESLRTNDVRGISLAGGDLYDLSGDLAESRGLVGSYAQRVEGALLRETDRATLDEATRSNLRDLDFAAAATRFSLLQTQLQAGLQTAGRVQQLSLLDYL
jgi:flagellin-like hook-associated protein FlgL